MRQHTFPFCIMLAALAAGPVHAKLDGRQLHGLSADYVTPHLIWASSPSPALPRVLFIVPRSGAREVIELHQRLTMNWSAYLCYDHTCIAKSDMYDAPYEGTSLLEKQQELMARLESDYDLIVLGEVLFRALPDEAKYIILTKVEKGAGLLLVQQGGPERLPYRKLYLNRLPEPDFLLDFPRSMGMRPEQTGPMLQASQLGAGRIVHLSYYGRRSHGLSLTPYLPYNREWAARYENALAWVGRLCLWTASVTPAATCRSAALAETPTFEFDAPVRLDAVLTGLGQARCRLRNQFNQVLRESDYDGQQLVLSDLAPGSYFCDFMVRQGEQTVSFGYYEFAVASPVGKVDVAVPEVHELQAAINGRLTLEKPFERPLRVRVELMDSPYDRVWHRREFTLASGQAALDWQLPSDHLPTIAAIVRCTLVDASANNREVGSAETTVFFPDYRLDDYIQMVWNNIDESVGPMTAPVLIDRLGWTLGLSHPSSGGSNARVSALFNQRFVSYMTRICVTKGAGGGAKQYRWFFLPSGYEEKIKALNEDECFYRPEVQALWAAGIAHRITNLPKYSPVIYSLGDENSLDLEAGFGPSDLMYFRQFLEKKYDSIAALNREWQSDYASFAEVPHPTMKESREQGNFPAWFDHRQYMEKMYADIHHFAAAEIKKHDPCARVGAEGSVPGELELSIENLEFWGPYSNLINDEVLRSFGDDRTRMLWWGGYPSSHGGRRRYPMPILGDLLKGTVNGNAWFTSRVGNHGVMSCDFDLAPYVKNYLPYLDDLRWGQAALLINNPQVDSGIGIYWSHPSQAASMLDDRCFKPGDGIGAIIRYGYQRGLAFDFVSSRTLSRLEQFKIVFLCGASALSDAEGAALRRFVERGGVLVADLNPAIMNGFLRPLPANPLADLFGEVVFDTLSAPVLGEAEVSAEWRGRPLRFKARKTQVNPGASFWEARALGQGQAILLHFGLGAAANTAAPETPLAGFLDQVLEGVGCVPPFQVACDDPYALIRSRQGRGFRLLGILLSEAKVGSVLSAHLPEAGFVYESKKGFLAQADRLELPFTDTPYKLLSIFPERQAPPELRLLAATVARGSAVSVDIRSLPAGRVYFLELKNPSGVAQLTRHRVFDTAKVQGSLSIPFAYSDVTGRWQLTLQDVATGLAATASVEVQP